MKPIPSPRLICFFTLLLLALGIGAAVRPEPEDRAATDSANLRALPLDFSSTNSISLQSSPVSWRGYAYHLLQFGTIKFDLDLDRDNGHLTAELRGGATSFDNVDYDISAAVFGSQGQLLGTARAQQTVERVWLGKTMQTSVTVTFDFGSSLDYAAAKKFQLSISNRKVLTPDDWQKSK
jgi:hypothetical protein